MQSTKHSSYIRLWFSYSRNMPPLKLLQQIKRLKMEWRSVLASASNGSGSFINTSTDSAMEMKYKECEFLVSPNKRSTQLISTSVPRSHFVGHGHYQHFAVPLNVLSYLVMKTRVCGGHRCVDWVTSSSAAVGAKQPPVLACINRLINGALFGCSFSSS